jgi:septal ring factor EnvC (AmiA/AmiB activator)
MSTPYDYSPQPAQPSGSWAFHLPVLLLTMSFCLYMAAQIRAMQQGAKTMEWQRENVEKQIAAVKNAQKQADDAAQKMAEPVKQASALQNQFSALFNDVYELSKDDEDAKKVVQKWKIQKNQNAESEGKKKE